MVTRHKVRFNLKKRTVLNRKSINSKNNIKANHRKVSYQKTNEQKNKKEQKRQKINNEHIFCRFRYSSFLGASLDLCKRVCLSVYPFVRMSVSISEKL